MQVNVAMLRGCIVNISQCVTSKLDDNVISVGQSGHILYFSF